MNPRLAFLSEPSIHGIQSNGPDIYPSLILGIARTLLMFPSVNLAKIFKICKFYWKHRPLTEDVSRHKVRMFIFHSIYLVTGRHTYYNWGSKSILNPQILKWSYWSTLNPNNDGPLTHLSQNILRERGWSSQFQEEISPLVDLLTPVHPWLATLVTTNPPPMKLSQISISLKWRPAPPLMSVPVQSLAVKGAVPANTTWSLINFRTLPQKAAHQLFFYILWPGSCTAGAPGTSHQSTSHRYRAKPWT